MTTKAEIIKTVDLYSAYVRIPILNKFYSSPDLTPDDELYLATVCLPPNCIFNLQKGDIVYVTFEDNDASKPIILGYLGKLGTSAKLDIVLNSISVEDISFRKDSRNDSVNSNNIKQLHGLLSSVQDLQSNLTGLANLANMRIDFVRCEELHQSSITLSSLPSRLIDVQYIQDNAAVVRPNINDISIDDRELTNSQIGFTGLVFVLYEVLQ